MGRKRSVKSSTAVTGQQRKVVKSSVLRSCEVVTYTSHYHIENVLQRWSNYIKEYAWIYHDRDTYTQEDVEDFKSSNPSVDCPFNEGDLKVPHKHILLVFWQTMRSSTILNWFADPYCGQNSRINRIQGSLADAYAYLDHRNRPDKFQYPSQAIICSSREFWEDLDDYSDTVDPLRDALFERLEGVPYKDLVLRYGRDFIIHSSSVDYCVKTIQKEEGNFNELYLMDSEVRVLEDKLIEMQKEKERLESKIKALQIECK